MNIQPILFEQILRGDLQPWREANKHDEKFVPILGAIKQTEPEFQVLYTLEFYRYFNAKSRYYHKLITNEANNFCNQIIEQIGSDDDLRIIKYKLGEILKKKLPTLLRDTAKLIKANDYALIYINPHKSTFDSDTDHKSDAYVLQLLKVALVKVYLEIQEVFKEYATDFYMELEDLYLQYLNESIPEDSFLKTAPQVITIEPIKVVEKPNTSRKVSKSKAITFTYKQLATNPDALKNLLDSLKLNSLVDEKTTIYDLKKIFSGGENYNPIIWTGNVSDLYYFVVLIHNEFETVENVNPYHWQVTCNCFIKPDGSNFETTQLKSQKTPKQNAEMIKKVASQLN